MTGVCVQNGTKERLLDKFQGSFFYLPLSLRLHKERGIERQRYRIRSIYSRKRRGDASVTACKAAGGTQHNHVEKLAPTHQKWLRRLLRARNKYPKNMKTKGDYNSSAVSMDMRHSGLNGYAAGVATVTTRKRMQRQINQCVRICARFARFDWLANIDLLDNYIYSEF